MVVTLKRNCHIHIPDPQNPIIPPLALLPLAFPTSLYPSPTPPLPPVPVTKKKKLIRSLKYEHQRASPGAAVKLCLGDLLVMGSNPETASLHMQG